MKRFAILLAAVSTLLALAACGSGSGTSTPTFNTLKGDTPIVIAHRGASGELPEHTLEGYKLAISQGATCIEPDLELTKDGIIIARHEPMLDDTTNVAEVFPAARKSTRSLDGVTTTAYFSSDFTLAEIKTLFAKQPRPSRPQQFNASYRIPTLDEVIALAQAEGARLGKSVCIYPEIKHSTFHASVVNFGTNTFENKLVATLHAAYGNTTTAPVFIQSFEVSNLQYLRTQTKIKLVQLIDADDVNADGSLALVAPYNKPYDFAIKNDTRTFADLLKPAGLDFIKTYADGIGPWKPYLVKTVADNVDRNADGKIDLNDRRVDGSTGVIELAHSKGLLVHAFTFRNDASGYGFKDPKAEMQYYFRLGADGLFTDFTATGVEAVKGLLRGL